MNNYGIKIIGTGHFAPENILTNHDLEAMVDTSDEWIFTRTGIRQRHIGTEHETATTMAYQASLNALAEANTNAEDIDLIIFATLTPDKICPNNGSLLQKMLGCTGAAAFSIEAACSGFVYGLEIASGMMTRGQYKKALIIGAEKLSSVVNWEDRNTCVLFGDGAGAAVLECVPEADNAYLGGKIASDGNYHDILHIPAGGTACPYDREGVTAADRAFVMNGREVFKLAVNNMANTATQLIADCGLTADDIDWLIPHQANIRIIEAVGNKMNFPSEKVFVNVDQYGNTSAATIPIALSELKDSGQLKKGQKVLFVAFGGGLTWGANIVQF